MPFAVHGIQVVDVAKHAFLSDHTMPPKAFEFRVKNPDGAVRLAAALTPPIEAACPPLLAKLLRTRATTVGLCPIAYMAQHFAVACGVTGPGFKVSVSPYHTWRISPRMWVMQVSTSGGGKTQLYNSNMRVINAHELRIHSRYKDSCPKLVHRFDPRSMVASEVRFD